MLKVQESTTTFRAPTLKECMIVNEVYKVLYNILESIRFRELYNKMDTEETKNYRYPYEIINCDIDNNRLYKAIDILKESGFVSLYEDKSNEEIRKIFHK